MEIPEDEEGLGSDAGVMKGNKNSGKTFQNEDPYSMRKNAAL